MPNTPYRVVQWTTGNVGKSSVEAIAKNPNYELVGLYAWSQDKAGRDAGELAGIEPLGVKATNDVDALLALKPDVVVYNPMWIDVDELVRILEAGVNVVSSASFITGDNLGDGRDKIEEACKRGNATLFGSGVSPGFAELLAIVAATACDRVDKITISESADTTLYDSPDTERPVGFGTAIDDPNLAPMSANGTAVFAEAVRLVADSIGVELDEIKCVSEYAQTTEDLEMASWTIPAGHVAGVYASWQGLINEPAGGQRTVVDVNVRWKKGQTLDPDWQLDGDGWKITIEGRPTVNMQVGFLPPQDMIENAKSIEDFFVLGHIMTAMPPIHAIPAVVAAPPGIATYNDLPLPQARGVGPRR
ncbi:dihydrodipicolinate reductase [Mycobacterium sp. 1164985.4]|uniref:NAD(P)H-dependent amine dehydrogenase family protein n=1 Tax=Mycobacterium sp. 1164985.4 TaxID=1834069 RepID=UPI0007FC76BE|nr:dihydrodipicolinate reductase [Mycobacterium sp. 1164985.4]OBK79661.1 dihydrodipicolinate reductase [Mycobacterium sp. 1164985.4]